MRSDKVIVVNDKFEGNGKTCHNNPSVEMNLDDINAIIFSTCDYPLGIVKQKTKDDLPSWFWDNKLY